MIGRVDDVVTLAQRVNAASEDEDGVGVASKEYAQLFEQHFRMPKGASNLMEKLSQTIMEDANVVDKDVAGGILIPADYQPGILELVGKNGTMRQSSNVITTTRDSVVFNHTMNDPEIQWVGERETRNDTDTVEFGDEKIEVMEVAAKPKISNKFLEDVGFDFRGWLTSRLGRAFTRGEENSFLNGSLQTRPRGLLTYPTVADANWSWGNIGFIKTDRKSVV